MRMLQGARLIFRRPSQTPTPPTRRRAANARRAVVVALIAFAISSLGVGVGSEFYPRLRDPSYGDKLAKWQTLIRTSPTQPRIMMLGTSRTGFAFHGARIEARLTAQNVPAHAFNFGIPASGPILHRLYLERLIAANAAPDLLILEVLPSMLEGGPHGPLERHWVFGDRLLSHECEPAIGFGFERDKIIREWYGATFNPFHQLRFQLMGRVLQSWIPWHLRYDWSRGADANGWGTPIELTRTPEQRAAGTAHAKLEYFNTLQTLVPGGGPERALRELVQLCHANKITVHLLLMPESQEFQTWYHPDASARLDQFLAKVCREESCELIDARSWLADEQFSDGHHQLRDGAEAFSDRLTDTTLSVWLQHNAGARK